jgi:hypothetical protein
MGILFPDAAVARRWNGALQARLRRAPLEKFLRARAIAPAPVGVSQDSDNLVRATVLIVEGGLTLYCDKRTEGLALPQRELVGHMACLVSRSLAELISNPLVWRVVALVSTARLLSPWIGLNAAAMSSAASARQFQQQLPDGVSATDVQVSQGAAAAIGQCSAKAMAQVSAVIALRLNRVAARDCAPA